MTHDTALPGHADAMVQMEKTDKPPQSFAARLLDWPGRFHPMLVHFPIAFIPAALFTAIVGRKRPGFAKPVQFLVLGLEPAADVIKMAQMTIDNQGAEIEALNALARNGTASSESAKIYETASSEMHREMMAASGETPSETYLAKMLAHHRGAVAMSDIALANGATGQVRNQIEETRAEQVKEVAMVEAMLRGEPMAAPATSNDHHKTVATPEPMSWPAAARSNPNTAKPGSAAPTPTQTETPIDPHAGHDMSDMNGM